MQHPAMLALLLTLLHTLRSALRTRAELALENLALRQQLAALRRLRTRAGITVPLWPPIHPGWLRCSSSHYVEYSSSCAPRQPGASTAI